MTEGDTKDIEDRLKDVTVGKRSPLNSTIHLEEYIENWDNDFKLLQREILRALGEKVIQLEHVGSTSIISMPAKPIIDMLLVVDDSGDEAKYVPQLEAIGYVLRIREPNWQEHRVLKSPNIDGNLHVFSQGCEEINRMITFREWLNSNPIDRDLYENEKRRLAKIQWRYTQEYADAKSKIVNEILTRAMSQSN